MRSRIAALLTFVTLVASGCAPGMSASLQVRSAPTPPSFEFRGDPRFDLLADLGVSVIADDDFGYDLFRCDGSYYLYSGGYWYRSFEPRGPYVAIEARRVPRRVFEVDDHRYRWRAHPEGWRGGRARDDDRRHDDDDRRGGDRDGR